MQQVQTRSTEALRFVPPFVLLESKRGFSLIQVTMRYGRIVSLATLVNIFHTRIKGVPLPEGGHDGAIGHWIESKFGVSPNRDDSADWAGYELKSGRGKTTFGDWSADFYLWNAGEPDVPSRDRFLTIFGTQSRPDRPGRYSWSGRVFPTVHGYNEYGQVMVVEPTSDIRIYYSYSRDCRPDKASIVPHSLQRDSVILAEWKRTTLQGRVNQKFGQNGWVKFVQSGSVITGMMIGGPMYFEEWIQYVQTGEIYLDSGMYYDPYRPNNRPYANWRASNNFWEGLADEFH